jgi:hypothetical protein
LPLIAEYLGQEGQQLSKRRDVSDASGSDVLDPAGHPARWMRARVEMQYERPVGWQLDYDGATGRLRS